MMDDLFNNINVFHKGTKVSIAQHWDCPSSRLNGTAAIQEVAIVPEDGSVWDTAYIRKYSTTLDGLIFALQDIRDKIDAKEILKETSDETDYKIHNESSGESYARTAQSATGSAT